MAQVKDTERDERQTDYRTRLYERYVTTQLKSNAGQLRSLLNAGSPYQEKLVRKFFPANRSVSILDIGCGFGPLLHTLKKLDYTNISGLDASPEQVKVAHQLGLECVRCGDIADELLGTNDSTWDVITAIDVLEHFSKDEVLFLLDNIHRVLKPGGLLILHVPNGEAIFSGKIYFGDFTHQVAFTRKSISQVTLCSGFASVRCYEDAPIAHGLLSGVRAIFWQFIRNWYRFVNAVETGEAGGELIFSQNLLAICRKSAQTPQATS
jgi:2-polyprenyl-3-methyl-5-hydroxy-6-metoxy-1,4-benzoquinol methylase